jgi:hypothetical protein
VNCACVGEIITIIYKTAFKVLERKIIAKKARKWAHKMLQYVSKVWHIFCVLPYKCYCISQYPLTQPDGFFSHKFAIAAMPLNLL